MKMLKTSSVSYSTSPAVKADEVPSLTSCPRDVGVPIPWMRASLRRARSGTAMPKTSSGVEALSDEDPSQRSNGRIDEGNTIVACLDPIGRLDGRGVQRLSDITSRGLNTACDWLGFSFLLYHCFYYCFSITLNGVGSIF